MLNKIAFPVMIRLHSMMFTLTGITQIVTLNTSKIMYLSYTAGK